MHRPGFWGWQKPDCPRPSYTSTTTSKVWITSRHRCSHMWPTVQTYVRGRQAALVMQHRCCIDSATRRQHNACACAQKKWPTLEERVLVVHTTRPTCHIPHTTCPTCHIPHTTHTTCHTPHVLHVTHHTYYMSHTTRATCHTPHVLHVIRS